MGIQAVFFDMGGTLETFWCSRQLRLEAMPGLREHLRSAGIDLGLGDEALYEVVSTGYKHYHQWSIQSMEELPPERVWTEFIFTAYPAEAPKIATIAENLMFYLENHFFKRELRPDVPLVLETIQKMGLKIGLISNVCSQSLVPFNLQRYGIIHYFDPIVLSSKYGRRKPDPSIFHYAARLAKVPTSQCLYIGDRIARDIVGARRAGFRRAIQIINGYDHGEEDSGAEPDAVIHQMIELLDIIVAEVNITSTPTPQGQIRALLFDAGDILYHRPNRGRYLRRFLDEQGIHQHQALISSQNALKRRAYHGEISQEQYREAILRLYGITEQEKIEHGKRMMELDDNDIQIFKGVPQTLRRLKEQGYLLGIITDTANPLHIKLSWFEKGGFGDVWDSIISSQELGVQKPAPQIYTAALQQLGVSANQTIFVGHSPEELEGARSLGIQTVAFNYDKTVRADFYIEKFADLLKVPLLSVGMSRSAKSANHRAKELVPDLPGDKLPESNITPIPR